MKAPFSPWLTRIADGLKEIVHALDAYYDYVSILSTDSTGFQLMVSGHIKNVSTDTMMSERGTVVRVARDGLYAEYAFNAFDGTGAKKTAEDIRTELDKQIALIQKAQVRPYETPPLPDEEKTLFVEMETGVLPEETDAGMLSEAFLKASDRAIALSENVIDCYVQGTSTHVSKLFLTKGKDLRQSYVFSEGYVAVDVTRDGKNRSSYATVSGRQGPELFDALPEKAEEVARVALSLLDAEHIVPGEYDIITSPEVTGLIAHEAFGHGVEMDMFVKGRALGAEYIGRRVGSTEVTMHEGALSALDVASYAFDDEGTPAGDVIEIDKGILKTGICDALSALRLHTQPTGNGKRENYAHKVYTRMTNTVFDAGEHTLEEMIASISHGYLLKGMQSGMEDPKHWGIQCIIERGEEIKDGKLTGRIVAPLVMTGYVPDLLGSVSMRSRDFETYGAGACGKGYKEWVKVSDGGPYLKARARLG